MCTHAAREEIRQRFSLAPATTAARPAPSSSARPPEGSRNSAVRFLPRSGRGALTLPEVPEVSPWAAVADLAGWRGGGEAAGREAERQGGERRVARVNVLSLEGCHVAANFVFVAGVRGSGVKEAVQCVRGGLDGPIVLRMGELLRGQGVRPGLSVMGGRLPLDVPEALIADAMVEDEVVVDVLQAAVEHHCMQALMSSVIRSKQDHGGSARAEGSGSSSVNNSDGAGTCQVPVLRCSPPPPRPHPSRSLTKSPPTRRFVVEGFPRTAGQVALWVNTGYSIDRALIQGTTAGRNPNPFMEGLVPAGLKGVLLTPEERALGNTAAALQARGAVCVCGGEGMRGGCARVHVSLPFSHACIHPGTWCGRCGDEGVGQCDYLVGTDARGDNGALVPCVERRACMCPEHDEDVWVKTLAHLVVSLMSPGMTVAIGYETSPSLC